MYCRFTTVINSGFEKYSEEMYEYQYLVGAILSFSVSIQILVKRPRTLPSKILILFGLSVAIWETLSFLSKRAPDEIAAANLFIMIVLTSHLGYPLYLLTFLNVPKKIGVKSLILVIFPVLIDMILITQTSYSANFNFVRTEFGWTYRLVAFSPALGISTIVYLGYLAAIIVGLFALIKKTSFPSLRRKYLIFFISFVSFQVFGIVLTNALVVYNLVSPIFQMGGIFHLLTFLSIQYALSMKEKEIPVSVMGKDFSQVYSSFLTIFYNSVTGSQLGEELFRFTDFISESNIEDKVSIKTRAIVFEAREDLDLGNLIDTNLRTFAQHHESDEITDYYLRVLNAVPEKPSWTLELVVKRNEDFLKKSDLIYGISRGKFLEEIVQDESLKDLDDIEACLKIYKRILLPVIDRIQVNPRFREKIIERCVAQGLKISDYGEISIVDVRKRLLEVPKNQRISIAIEKLNSIVSWVYEALLVEPTEDVEEILEKLRLVFSLNKDRAVALGVYPSLLGTLATKIPKTQIHRLYSDFLEELVEERTRELKETQENLLKSQRLATIGEAAGMVGHDLRNPLQATVNVLYLVQKKLESSQYNDLEELLETVSEQVEYMNKIVSDLQDYSRPVKPKLVETDMHQLLNETLSSVRIPEDVKVSMEIEEDTNFPKLLVDPSLMKRVFINLTVNALQAMPQGGQLRIKAYRTGETASISFQDTGIGISPENLQKIFQPLFTTKAKGQGFGLAVCKRLIEGHGGNIMVESKAGRGTTFTVEIPRQESNE